MTCLATLKNGKHCSFFAHTQYGNRYCGHHKHMYYQELVANAQNEQDKQSDISHWEWMANIDNYDKQMQCCMLMDKLIELLAVTSAFKVKSFEEPTVKLT